MSESPRKPAFYAVGRGAGGPGDWLTLLHPPYTLWHLAYVAIGAAVMRPLVASRLWLSLLAFFLAVGIGAHALDELRGRPLRTGISGRALALAAAASIAGAVALGVIMGGWRLLPFIVVGGWLVVAYNLELVGGFFHNDVWFAAAWGAFPVLTGAFAQHWTLSVAAVVAAVAAFFLSLGQRALSTPARMLRRQVTAVSGVVTFAGGEQRRVSGDDLLAPLERALRYLVWAVSAVALAMVLAR